MDNKTITMKQARKQYRSMFYVVTETPATEDAPRKRTGAWRAGAPGFRTWARVHGPVWHFAVPQLATGKLALICRR